MHQKHLKYKFLLFTTIAITVFAAIGFGQSTFFLNELKPVSTTGWYWEFGSTTNSSMGGGNSMTMSGKKYTNGFKFGEPGTATFNLSKKYSELTGEIGLDDFENKKDTAVSFYGDGKLIKYIELKAQSLPQSFTLDVTGVSQLQIKKEIGYSEVNLANLKITKQTASTEKLTTEKVDGAPSLKDGVYLLDVLEPYEKGRFYWPFGKISKTTLGGENSMTMKSVRYFNGFKLGEPGYAIFNLQGQYKAMVATVGLDDFENKKSTAVEFYGDGALIKKVDLPAGTLPVSVSLDLTGVKQFKIIKTVGYAEVNLAEIQVSKNPSALPVESQPTTSQSSGETIKDQTVILNKPTSYAKPTKIAVTLKENATIYSRDSKNALASLSKIKALNNGLVAVGTGGIVYESTDKLNWKVSNANTFKHLMDVAFGDGKYLVVSREGYLAWTTDLTVWNEVDTSKLSKNFVSVVYHKGEFVVLCENGVVYGSKDAKNFYKKTQVINTEKVTNFTKIKIANDKFYVLTSVGAYVSEDAINWNPLKLSYTYEMDGKLIKTDSFETLDIASGNGLTIITGTSGFFSSKNGVDWKHTPLANAPKSKNNSLIQNIKSIVFHNNVFHLFVHEFNLTSYRSNYVVAVDQSGEIINNNLASDIAVTDSVVYQGEIVAVWNDVLVSKDGQNFKSMNMDFAQADFSEANGYYFIAQDQYLTVYDQSKHISRSVLPFVYAQRGIKQVAYGNGVYVAVGDEQSIFTSKDLKVWQSVNDAMKDNDVQMRPTISSIVFYQNKFIAMDYAGYQYHSTDGVNWSRQKVGEGYDSLKVQGVVNGQLTAVGMYEHRASNEPLMTYGLVLTSKDGLEWTPHYVPRIDRATSVSYLNGTYLIEGLATMYATSKDLKNFQVFELDLKSSIIKTENYDMTFPVWQNILSDGNQFYGLVFTSDLNHRTDKRIGFVLKSNDGINWVWQVMKDDAEIVTLKSLNGSIVGITRNGDLLTLNASSKETVTKPTSNNGITVYIDNVLLALTNQPVVVSGRTLVPMAEFFNALGATVEWVPETRSVKANRGNINISIVLGSNKAMVNGKEVTIDVTAQVFDGRTFVPLAFVSQALGETVEWKAETKSIYIKKN